MWIITNRAIVFKGVKLILGQILTPDIFTNNLKNRRLEMRGAALS